MMVWSEAWPSASLVIAVWRRSWKRILRPARLQAFLRKFDASFIGGAGTAAQLESVRRDYGISARKIRAGDGYAYSHSSFTYLIDRAGRIRALMPYGHSPGDYVNDLRLLLKE